MGRVCGLTPEGNDFLVCDVITIGSREIIRKKRLFGNDIKSFRHSLYFNTLVYVLYLIILLLLLLQVMFDQYVLLIIVLLNVDSLGNETYF